MLEGSPRGGQLTCLAWSFKPQRPSVRSRRGQEGASLTKRRTRRFAALDSRANEEASPQVRRDTMKAPDGTPGASVLGGKSHSCSQSKVLDAPVRREPLGAEPSRRGYLVDTANRAVDGTAGRSGFGVYRSGVDIARPLRTAGEERERRDLSVGEAPCVERVPSQPRTPSLIDGGIRDHRDISVDPLDQFRNSTPDRNIDGHPSKGIRDLGIR